MLRYMGRTKAPVWVSLTHHPPSSGRSAHLHYSHTQKPATSSNKVLALEAHPSLLLLSF